MYQQRETGKLDSPTTPGMMVTPRNYCIELICLNVNRSLPPKFWLDNKYWGPKFKREVGGISRLGKKLANTDLDLGTPFNMTILASVIQAYCVKSLTANRTMDKVITWMKKKSASIQSQRSVIVSQAAPVSFDITENMRIVDVGESTPLSKIKKITQNGQT